MFTVMKSTILRKALWSFFLLMVFIIFLWTVYVIWEKTRDPLQAIKNVDLGTRLVYQQTEFDSILAGKRYYTDIQLFSRVTDTIKTIISFPQDYATKKLPVITILGGHRISRQNFNFIKNPGDNIITIFIYPYQAEQWEKGSALLEIPRVRRAILKTPGQIAELNHWIQKQSWCDTNRVSLLGYSFGAFFVPAVEQVSLFNHLKTGPLIISYGGADFELLLDKNLKVKPKWLRPWTAWFGATLIYALDPLHYASKMKEKIYLINGLHDEQIPRASWQLLHNLVPASAKKDILNEGHMHPRKPELTQKLVDMSRNWLKEQGILN